MVTTSCSEEVPSEMDFGVDAQGKIHGYYSHFFGHPVEFFNHIHSQLPGPYVYFLGDSTLDNKFWMKEGEEWAPAANGFDKVFEPPEMKTDVAYWVNKLAEEKGMKLTCLNTAVEGSTIMERKDDRPGRFYHASDEFVHDMLTPNDIVVFSAVGNDIVLKVTWKTFIARTWLMWFSWYRNIRSGRAWGMQHMINLIKVHSRDFLVALCDKQKPKYILSVMCYYPLEAKQGAGWADLALAMCAYNIFPRRLQAMLRSIFEHGCAQLDIPGTTVLPVPFFLVLNGKNPEDFMERAEPSKSGGKKEAELLLEAISKGKDFDAIAQLPDEGPDSIGLCTKLVIGFLFAALVSWRVVRKP